MSALAYLQASTVRGHLAEGRDDLIDARSALLAGDADAAAVAFRDAGEAFEAASGAARGPIARLFTPLPVLGRSPDAMAAIADAGGRVADAGTTLSAGIATLPDGLASLAPHDHRIPLDEVVALTPTIADAAARAAEARALLQATATSLLAPPVADARAAALDEISGLATSLADAQVVFERMPWFLGADGPRRYLFGAQNPAELRGTGGLLGVYAILTIDDGDFVFSRFRPDTNAPNVPTEEVDAPADYERLYTQFGGAGFWLNANMSPDLPSTAVALENLWRESGRGDLDGVILADPFAFRAMLEATGPVRPPSLDVELTSTNVVDYVTNGVYTDIPVPDERKEALGEAVHAVVDAFMTSSSSSQASLDAMTEILGAGHAQVYVDDRELQGVLAGGVVGGALASDDADLLGVVINSAGGNKVDFYLDASIEHTVRLGDDGSASASTEIELHNDAPLEGAPRYVLGPFAGVSRRGENVMLLQTYCSERCAFTDKRSEGNVEDHGTAVEQGLPFTWDYVRIPSGETATVRYATALDEAWIGDRFGGTYRFRYAGPPTIRPTQMRLSVTVPAGMEITSTSVPMEIVGSTATWSGDPARLLDIEVAFRPPPLRRAWLFAWHVVTRPLVQR